MKDENVLKEIKNSILNSIVNEEFLDSFKAKLRAEIFTSLVNNNSIDGIKSAVNTSFSNNINNSNTEDDADSYWWKSDQIYDYIMKIIVMDYLEKLNMTNTLTVFRLETTILPEINSSARKEIISKVNESPLNVTNKKSLNNSAPMLAHLINCLEINFDDVKIESSTTIATDNKSDSSQSNT